MKRFLLLAFSLLLFTSSLLAQTGKVAGTITDRTTGEPLIGVNVIIEGTMFGAATDLDGYYTILSVPPGSYSLRVTYIGYTAERVTNIVVNINETVLIDLQMSDSSVETAEVIVTAAKIPIVQQDVSSSRANINSEEIGSLPTINVNRVLGLQAGIQSTDEGIVVRGGALNQTAYILNGVTLRDERDNKPYTGISVTSIENMQVQS
ncbi:MAG: carboxypeptidase-like regulatory domain-containing protein, partial [Melioribacteraceae bacterium]|nr:carboxypeptidase-like regulatory domain-containing protein [Melioribacteraceae bacterium]